MKTNRNEIIKLGRAWYGINEAQIDIASDGVLPGLQETLALPHGWKPSAQILADWVCDTLGLRIRNQTAGWQAIPFHETDGLAMRLPEGSGAIVDCEINGKAVFIHVDLSGRDLYIE